LCGTCMRARLSADGKRGRRADRYAELRRAETPRQPKIEMPYMAVDSRCASPGYRRPATYRDRAGGRSGQPCPLSRAPSWCQRGWSRTVRHARATPTRRAWSSRHCSWRTPTFLRRATHRASPPEEAVIDHLATQHPPVVRTDGRKAHPKRAESGV
jgi:hypothetical protein